MKTNRKLQLLAAATVAMLAINPAARAQTPAPLSDEMLLHALATGQIPSSQLGVGGGDDEKRAASASPGTPSIIVGGIGIDYAATESYGGGFYLQGGTTARQLGVGGGDDEAIRNGYRDADGDTYGSVASYGGGIYLQGQSTAHYGGALYYGGAIYNAAAGSPPVNSWYNDFYINTAGVAAGALNGDGFADNDCDGIRKGTSQPANGIVADDTVDWYLLAGQSGSNVVYVYPGLYLQGQPTASYGGAIYNTTAGSLYGEDFPGDALVGEDLPGDALTDAQLDALILESLAGVCDDADNCLVAPVRR
ncbi:MAG: hypothetical protein JNG86_04175 [Verrucomicrobiaceae bacterium]|nr:hypothetical protein [Verrucomicrobiaceae bacterium]